MHGYRAAPSGMALGLSPAAGKHVILAIWPFDDLSIPIDVLCQGHVLEAVVLFARANRGGAPCVRLQLVVDGRR